MCLFVLVVCFFFFWIFKILMIFFIVRVFSNKYIVIKFYYVENSYVYNLVLE